MRWKSFSRRLAEFQERAESLKRKVKGAMVYPIVVVSVAVGILTFIMIKIVPAFQKIFEDFDIKLPPMTDVALIKISYAVRPLLVFDSRHSDRDLAVRQTAAQVQLRPHRLGFVHAQDADLRPVGRKEHRGPHHAHPGHAGGQRRADSGSAEHHARNGRQRHVRADVRQGQRIDPRGRKHRQADEGTFRADVQCA